MEFGYHILLTKTLFGRKVLNRNSTNCPYFLSILWPKTPY